MVLPTREAEPAQGVPVASRGNCRRHLVFFDDFVAVANCCEGLELLSRSFTQSRKQKIAIRNDTAPNLPLGAILDNLQKHAEDLRAEVGDLKA